MFCFPFKLLSFPFVGDGKCNVSNKRSVETKIASTDNADFFFSFLDQIFPDKLRKNGQMFEISL